MFGKRFSNFGIVIMHFLLFLSILFIKIPIFLSSFKLCVAPPPPVPTPAKKSDEAPAESPKEVVGSVGGGSTFSKPKASFHRLELNKENFTKYVGVRQFSKS